MSVRRLAALGCAVALTAGCGHVVGRRIVTHTLPPVVTTPTPKPARTVIRAFHHYRAGQPALIEAQAGVSLRLVASRPRVSRTRLSSSYGYPPQHGYYLTFRIAVANTGSRPLDIGPRDFLVRMPGQGQVTSYDGNSPYSGAPRQLDTTELEPGDSVSAPLTFDVRGRHGRLDYRPGGSTAAAWSF